MNPETVNIPAIRSWRDIPQPVRPRAMSRGGRWRRAMGAVRTAALGVFLAGSAWGIWLLAGTLGRAPSHVPDAAKSVALRRLEFHTSAGGVLDLAWLERTLALPTHVALMELDLVRLRARLLAEGQVASASLARNFPDRLVVRITERMPVARIRVEMAGAPRDLLVAPDGFVFAGTGYEPAMLDSLPWLSGISLVAEGNGFQPIAGLAPVAQLLSDAQFSAMHLYQSWLAVSLARLPIDREIEVTTKTGTTVIFSAKGDFFVQLATLDYLLEKLANTTAARARIDLTLGRNVPVTIELPAAPAEPKATVAAPAPRPAAAPAAASASSAPVRFSVFSTSSR